MKKLVVIAFITVLSIRQTEAQVKFSPGFRAGLNYSNITDLDSNFKTGFYLGAIGELNLTKHYALQPEIGYTAQGAKNATVQTYNNSTGNYKTTSEDLPLNYASLTIINKFTFVEGFHALVGPVLDVTLGGDRKKVESDIDVAITAGLGYTMPSGLSVELRYKKGIADVANSSYFQGSNDFLFSGYNTNSLFQIGVTYKFDTK
jgi:Outer membrane protein beta-barrel domain